MKIPCSVAHPLVKLHLKVLKVKDRVNQCTDKKKKKNRFLYSS